MIRCILSMLLTAMFVSASSAQLIETLAVPAADEDGVMSANSLALGQLYELTASGSVFISGTRVADSEYADFDDPSQIQDILNSTDIGMAIDGVDIDWGPFNENNTYSTNYTGTGNPLTALFRDTLYVDNRDELTLTITQVPEPGSTCLAWIAVVGFLVVIRQR